MRNTNTNTVEMVPMKYVGGYFRIDEDGVGTVQVPRNRLVRIQKPITVEAKIMDRLFRKPLVGYKNLDTGEIMVFMDQLEANFS